MVPLMDIPLVRIRFTLFFFFFNHWVTSCLVRIHLIDACRPLPLLYPPVFQPFLVSACILVLKRHLITTIFGKLGTVLEEKTRYVARVLREYV